MVKRKIVTRIGTITSIAVLLLTLLYIVNNSFDLYCRISPGSCNTLTPYKRLVEKGDSLAALDKFQEALNAYVNALLLESNGEEARLKKDGIIQKMAVPLPPELSDLKSYFVQIVYFKGAKKRAKLVKDDLVEDGFPEQFINLKGVRNKYIVNRFQQPPENGVSIYFQREGEADAGNLLFEYLRDVYPLNPISRFAQEEKEKSDLILEVVIK